MNRIIMPIFIFVLGVVIGFVLSPVIHRANDVQIANTDNSYEAVKLHSNEGNYITWGIKEKNSTDNVWTYIVPRWFSKYFGVQLFWCNDSRDFIIHDGDTGIHLFVYDASDRTWRGSYYLKDHTIDGKTELFYWEGSSPVAPYARTNLPEEIDKLI